MNPLALAALVEAAERLYANPHSSDHSAGWLASEATEVARAQVGEAVGVDPDEVIFTSGATEADNAAILGIGGYSSRKRIIVSAIEHKAVLGPAREMARRGYDVAIAPVNAAGVVDAEILESLLDEQTALVSVMLVNNELGTVQPVSRIGQACRAAGALFHIDAAQAMAWLPFSLDALNADLLSISAHKMGGPKGIGALVGRREILPKLRPLMFGGEQEVGIRPGTLPTALCASFGVACNNLPSSEDVDAWRRRTVQLEKALLAIDPSAKVNGNTQERHPGCISITFSTIDAEALITHLQPALAVSRGSACTSGIPEPSHVLRAIGLSAGECDRTLRISTGRFTSDREIAETVELFEAAIASIN